MNAVKNKQYRYVKLDSNMAEIANRYPEAAQIMVEYGLHCIGCFANVYDTVETGTMLHGMNDKEVAMMLSEINTAIAKTQESELNSKRLLS